MIVCIAEKPSVARDIADILGAKERKDGYIEGNGYQVTWTFGRARRRAYSALGDAKSRSPLSGEASLDFLVDGGGHKGGIC